MKRTNTLLFTLTALCCFAAAARDANGQDAGREGIRITSHEEGTAIRYPVPLLRGSLADKTRTSVTVINRSSRRKNREIKGLAYEGRFKVLCELVPGKNEIVVRAGKMELPLTLSYKPQTNSRVVRAVYLTDKTGNTLYQTPLKDDPQDYEAKLGTAMKLMQTFTAERLHDHGYGRRTFNLEFDNKGEVVVHTFRGEHPAEHFHKLDGKQLYYYAMRRIGKTLSARNGKHLVVFGFSRFDEASKRAHAHTALGGGHLAVFGGANLFAWPSSLAEAQNAFMDSRLVDHTKYLSDSVGRHTFWAIASTTMGACLHELGHTFSIPHSRNPHDIMTRGFDRFNRAFTLVEPPHARRGNSYAFREDEVACWAPVSAEVLRTCPWFALDNRPFKSTNRTSISLDKKDRSIRITSDNRVDAVTLNTHGKAITHYPVLFLQNRVRPKQVKIPLEWIGERLGTDDFTIRAIDTEGLIKSVSMRDFLSIPYIRAWRVDSITPSWEEPETFIKVEPKDLKSLEASAAGGKPVTAKGPYVDLLAHFPKSKQARVAGYAACTVHSEKPQKVKIFVGSADGVRAWLNRELIAPITSRRAVQRDAKTAEVVLREGKNTFLVEVTRTRKKWGFYFRMEDLDGTPLKRTNEGSLEKSENEIRRILLRRKEAEKR